ncbi:glycosyltransferase [Litchfieldia salsa]
MSVYYKESPKFLLESIKSIINQTLLPNEIVIVQDGELTTELTEILGKYERNYPNLFKFIKLDQNVGLGPALAIGINECNNHIIARMDSDDICHPERFERQINYLNENPSIDVVGSWIGEFDQDYTEVTNVRKVPLSYQDVLNFAKTRNPLNHMTVVFRKKAVLDAGNYKPFLWNEDYYLWVRMLNQNYKIVNLGEILVYARTGSEMYKRRGGIQYLLKDISLQKEFLRMNFINRTTFYKNIIIRCFVRLLPNSLRGFVYKTLLRK